MASVATVQRMLGLPSILIGRPSSSVTNRPWARRRSPCRGVGDRHARLAVGRPTGIGHQFLFRHADAPGDPGQSATWRHQAQELAAGTGHVGL